MKKLKKIILGIVIILFIILIILIIRYKTKTVANVYISIPSCIEESVTYTYCIYPKGFNTYTYKKIKTTMWINEVCSREIVDSGDLKNKEQLDIIRKDIEEADHGYTFDIGSFYYKNEKLDTLDELAERLF